MRDSSSRPAASRRAVLRSLGVCTAAVGGCLGSPRGKQTGTTDAASSSRLSGTVRIAGSSTVYPLTLELGNRFTEAHPGVDVSLSSTGTGDGFANFFCAGRTDLNDASRAIRDDERAACAAAGVEPLRFQVATDALTVVVNENADWVSCVTLSELASVWREGGADRWRDVRPAWPDEPIELHGPTPASGTLDYFSEAVLGDRSHRADYAGTEQDETVVEAVRRSRYAMGYFGFAYYVRNRDAVRALATAADGGACVRPSFESARTGRYVPLSRPLYVYVDRAALSRRVVREFVAYYLDHVTGDVVRDVGYVPVSERTARRNRERLRSAVSEVV